MRFIKTTSLVLALGMLAGSTAAMAQQADSHLACAAAARQVNAAMRDSAQSNDAAEHEKVMGLQLCTAGYFEKGVAHYTKALELLNAKG